MLFLPLTKVIRVNGTIIPFQYEITTILGGNLPNWRNSFDYLVIREGKGVISQPDLHPGEARGWLNRMDTVRFLQKNCVP
jgi:hypothetical protein